MNQLEYKIQDLLEKQDFEKLSPAQQEMVLSVMAEEDFRNQREILLQAKEAFNEDRTLLVPNVEILADLKNMLTEKQLSKSERSAKKRKLPFGFLHYKLPIYQSAAAMILLLLGTYFLLVNTKGPSSAEIKYVDREEVKIIRDTVWQEKIVEVPVTKIVTKVEYKSSPIQPKPTGLVNNFAIEEVLTNRVDTNINLNDFRKSYGNTRIDEAELEQFRVSL